MVVSKQNRKPTIYFDMDGTLVSLYTRNWLKRIKNEDPTLFRDALVKINKDRFIDVCHRLQDAGFKIGVISYLPWDANIEYKQRVAKEKSAYLKRHFGNLFTRVIICNHTISKSKYANVGDIIFDDDARVRSEWVNGAAYDEKYIIRNLEAILNDR